MVRKLTIYIIALVVMFTLAVPDVQAASNTVTLNVTNAEVRDVLTALANSSGVSIIADDTVAGKVSLHLQNVPLTTALDIITKAKGLTYQQVGEVIVVGNRDQIGRGFGTLHIFKLQYSQPADVKTMVEALLFGKTEQHSSSDKTKNKTAGHSEGEQERLQIDSSTNSLLFYGSDAETAQIKQLLAEIDIPYQQVAVEAQVVALSSNATKDLGVDWRWSELPKYPEYDPPTYESVKDSDGNPYKQITEEGKYTRDKEDMVGTIQFGRSPGGYPYEWYYSAKISALVSKGDAKILAKPKITTINGQKAHILIGDRIPVPKETTDNDRTTTTFDYQDAGIILDYTPRINNDGEITVDLATAVSTPTLIPSLKAYQITTREAKTIVRLKDGETMVIGGLIGSQESGGVNKVPFFSDLPLLGKLFQSVHKTKNDTEVVIFLTAHIVK